MERYSWGCALDNERSNQLALQDTKKNDKATP